jgi:hypothetical protein
MGHRAQISHPPISLPFLCNAQPLILAPAPLLPVAPSRTSFVLLQANRNG